ncbi:hypothetical protein C8R45DRAFT_1109605 [Mycena sanguinolenta]|nr:hypothetical protein C8R45DRAFT_1109605 [Mycena sanguinolenta]
MLELANKAAQPRPGDDGPKASHAVSGKPRVFCSRSGQLLSLITVFLQIPPSPTSPRLAPSGVVGTLALQSALSAFQYLGFSINGTHHRRRQWPRRPQPLSHRACTSGIRPPHGLSLGGNSIKANSGTGGAGTEAQRACRSRTVLKRFTQTPPCPQAPTTRTPRSSPPPSPTPCPKLHGSGCFNFDLSVVSRLGEHTTLRIYCDKSGADFEDCWLEENEAVVDIEYEVANGSRVEARGNAVLAIRGSAA